MPGPSKKFIGLEGFVWYLGVVEDRNDPEQLGRVRVRCFGWHDANKDLIPTDALPWAHPSHPVNNPATYTPKEGDMVFGFFLDGDSAQNPVIIGVLPGKPEAKPDYTIGFSDPNKKYPKRINEPTTSRLARGRVDDTIVEKRKRNQKKNINSAGGVTWSEPAPAFAPKYPYNYAHESESGHAFELDDTAGKERVSLAHKTGTGIEMDSMGSRVDKIVKDNYTVIMGSDYVFIGGTCSVTVDGNCNLKVGGKLNIEASAINMAASGAVKIKGSDVKIESTGSMDLKAASSFRGGGAVTTSLTGVSQITLQAMNIDLAASLVNLQQGSADSPKGTGLSVGTSSAATVGATATQAVVATSSVGKLVAGGTALTNPTYTQALAEINTATRDLSSGLAVGELIPKMESFETSINGMSGDILSLEPKLLADVREGNFSVTEKAKEFGIDVALIDTMLPQSELFTRSGEYVSGKQLFPRTEYVLKIEGE